MIKHVWNGGRSGVPTNSQAERKHIVLDGDGERLFCYGKYRGESFSVAWKDKAFVYWAKEGLLEGDDASDEEALELIKFNEFVRDKEDMMDAEKEMQQEKFTSSCLPNGTFSQVMEEKRAFVRCMARLPDEALKEMGQDNTKGRDIAAFKFYLSLPFLSPDSDTTGDTCFERGEYKGETYASVVEKHGDYVNWAKSRKNPAFWLLDFLFYVARLEESLGGGSGAPPPAAAAAAAAPAAVTVDPRPAARTTEAVPGENNTVHFGRNRGKKFKWVRENDKSYCQWLLRHVRSPDYEYNRHMSDFAVYLQRRGDNKALEREIQRDGISGSEQMKFSKYSDKTFEWVRDNAPGFCDWCKAQEKPFGRINYFLRYLKQFD